MPICRCGDAVRGAIAHDATDDAALRLILQSWSIPDDATKDVIQTIVESRSSDR